jgi:hypothetical protein
VSPAYPGRSDDIYRIYRSSCCGHCLTYPCITICTPANITTPHRY